jgi:hypothetical protein
MIRSIFAGILSLIFSIVFLSSSILFVVLNTVLDSDFYGEEVSKEFYETTVDVMGSVVYRQSDDFQKFFTEDEIKNEFQKLLTAEDFRLLLVPFIEQVTEPEFDEDGIAVVTLDLTVILARLPDFAENVVSKLYDTLPKCEDPAQFVESELNCIPPEFPVEDFTSMVLATLDRDVISSLPSKVVSFEIYKQDLELFSGTTLSKGLLWQVWWMITVIEILLLLVIALVALKPWHKILRWVSKPLLSGAILVIILFFVLYQLPDIVSRAVMAESDAFTVGEVSSLVWFLKGFLLLVLEKALIYAVSVFLFGLGLYVAGLWGRHHSHV